MTHTYKQFDARHPDIICRWFPTSYSFLNRNLNLQKKLCSTEYSLYMCLFPRASKLPCPESLPSNPTVPSNTSNLTARPQSRRRRRCPTSTTSHASQEPGQLNLTLFLPGHSSWQTSARTVRKGCRRTEGYSSSKEPVLQYLRNSGGRLVVVRSEPEKRDEVTPTPSVPLFPNPAGTGR